jgi:hypothetical protein
MFHVLDHAALVYSGGLSQATQYVIERYGKKLDEAIQSGIKIAYTDPFHGVNEARQTISGNTVPDFWAPFDDWMVD